MIENSSIVVSNGAGTTHFLEEMHINTNSRRNLIFSLPQALLEITRIQYSRSIESNHIHITACLPEVGRGSLFHILGLNNGHFLNFRPVREDFLIAELVSQDLMIIPIFDTLRISFNIPGISTAMFIPSEKLTVAKQDDFSFIDLNTNFA